LRRKPLNPSRFRLGDLLASTLPIADSLPGLFQNLRVHRADIDWLDAKFTGHC
jgi:hypothetical protein